MIHTARIATADALHNLDAASIALAIYMDDADSSRPIGDQVRSVWVTATTTGWEVRIGGPCPSPVATHFTIDQVLAW